MYATSELLYKTFYHSKCARHHYVEVTASQRPTHALNKLAKLIDTGEITQTAIIALLNAGITMHAISAAISHSQQRKTLEEQEKHSPKLTAAFNTVPPALRGVNVPYFARGAATSLKLPQDIEQLNWPEQKQLITQLIAAHREHFYSDDMRSRRENYFGTIDGYHFNPAPHLNFAFNRIGELT
ncbi:hypothetical protein [Dasania marina]|uniref:hypothetical protein n=1 Tax=Dasania marina TaxID=471499 RepID=UPI0003684296|nr:hypothetical protein [Dasania marina]